MRLLWSIVWPRVPYALREEELTREKERITVLNDKTDDRWNVSQSILSRIEAKSAALLTHVSLMVALTGALWALSAEPELAFNRIPSWLFGTHFVGYLMIALLCIRCQLHIRSADYWAMERASPEDFFKGHDQSLDAQRRDRANRENRNSLENYFIGELALRERVYHFAFLALCILTLEFVILILWSIIPFGTLDSALLSMFEAAEP